MKIKLAFQLTVLTFIITSSSFAQEANLPGGSWLNSCSYSSTGAGTMILDRNTIECDCNRTCSSFCKLPLITFSTIEKTGEKELLDVLNQKDSAKLLVLLITKGATADQSKVSCKSFSTESIKKMNCTKLKNINGDLKCE